MENGERSNNIIKERSWEESFRNLPNIGKDRRRNWSDAKGIGMKNRR